MMIDGRKRWIGFISLLSTVVICYRSILITHAHSESWDDHYHIPHGIEFLLHIRPPYLFMNDPPLGKGIIALPALLPGMGVTVHRDQPPGKSMVIDWPPSERVVIAVAVWKSLLFVPLMIVAMLWCWELYGRGAAVLIAALLLIEPTIAAHIPIAALDVLGAEAIVIGCYLTWRWRRQPTTPRLLASSCACAAAMLVKHTALVLPFVVIGYIGVQWRRRKGVTPDSKSVATPFFEVSRSVRSLAIWLLLLIGFGWALTLFDVSRPAIYMRSTAWPGTIERAIHTPLPGGVYIGSFIEAVRHGREGHPAYLLGRTSDHGWWYYFSVVAAYKVPLGIWCIALLAVASLIWRRPRFDELSLLIPAIIFAAYLMASGINIGFRHFLPAYLFMLMLATRCVGMGAVVVKNIAAIAVIATAIETVARFHPDYLSYINGPWDKPYLAISDSNIDWGQGLKQAAKWIDANHDRIGSRAVYIRYFGYPHVQRYYLGNRAIVVNEGDPRPESGVLIVSPVFVAGAYSPDRQYMQFADRYPDDIIGHSLLVFDLDRNRK
jgi:hypothetical protein